MSSEDKTVDPSDQGPSPTSSSGGATSTGSPAHADKRPRGRPRKDAAAGTLLPSPPLSTSKTRKKGRTKGRFAADEEDSMDGTEIAESIGPQDTEMEAQLAETVELVTSEGPEEDRPSSPMVASPVAGQSAGPSVAASGELKSSERLCAFCCCGGRSLLGQGDLRVFSVAPELCVPHHRRRDGEGGGEVGGAAAEGGGGGGGGESSAGDGSEHDNSTPAPQATSGQRDKLNGSERHDEGTDPASRFWDELSHVGFPQDPDVRSLFASGQCWAHQSCGLWSEGVCQGEGQSLQNVDRAVDSGSTKHCAYCKRLGASIKCCAEGCAQLYHYPCAGAAGTHQDIRSLSLLCPDHVQLAIHRFADEVNCVLCDSPGDLQDQLFCTSCGLHYHGMCLDMAVTPLRRAGWQCPECKVCQTCKNPGEDTKMLVCDMCDKGYHTFCLQPAMDSLPTNGWRCKNCRVCVQCGTRTSGQWHHTSLLCENCVQHQDPNLCCPLCACVLDPEHHKDLLSCHLCKRWLHLECERQNSGQAGAHPREDYVCSSCRPPAADMDVGPEPSPQPASTHINPESGPQPAHKHTDLPSDAAPSATPPPPPPPPDMHNDPEPELLSVPSHSDPTPVKAAVQEERPPSDATTPDAAAGASVIGAQASESPVQENPTEVQTVKHPAAASLMTEPSSTDSPASPRSTSPKPRSLPAQLPLQEAPAQESSPPTTPTPTPTKPANSERSPEEGALQPSTKDTKAITSPTKEQSPPVSPDASDEPMEVSPSQPSGREGDRGAAAPERTRTDPHRESSVGTSGSPGSSAVEEEEMDTTPESIPNTGPSSEEKALEPLGETASSPALSSPLAPGTSPREPPLTQGLPPLGDHSSVQPTTTTTTLIPFTPKIGMGKPAITKRKFSPGRPRVKQGAWSPHSSVSSASPWSPDQPEGWDFPKTRQPPGSPGWSIRVVNNQGGLAGAALLVPRPVCCALPCYDLHATLPTLLPPSLTDP